MKPAKKSHKNFKKKKFNASDEEKIITRVRLPRGREVIGILEQRLGASRLLVKCLDGVSRNCKVPGRLRRKLWLREGNVVIVEPWEFDDSKGNVLFKYSPAEVQFLKRKGFLKEIEEEF